MRLGAKFGEKSMQWTKAQYDEYRKELDMLVDCYFGSIPLPTLQRWAAEAVANRHKSGR